VFSCETSFSDFKVYIEVDCQVHVQLHHNKPANQPQVAVLRQMLHLPAYSAHSYRNTWMYIFCF
jgi:hypothetical protein